jgi:hypothetical protein
MPRDYRLLIGCVFVLVLGTISGCLSLGTKTTHVHDNPDTKNRIDAMEQRLSALEQMFVKEGAVLHNPASPTP